MGKMIVTTEDVNNFFACFPEFKGYKEEINRKIKEFVRGDMFPRGLIDKIMPEKVAKSFKEYFKRIEDRSGRG